MKKLINSILLFGCLSANAKIGVVNDTVPQVVITKAGQPDGVRSQIEINKDGGSLKSSDGKVELIIPAGAVSKKTTISIQPVYNLMPNGNGKAYRLEPSGIQFQKSIQLIFHYTDKESAGDMQALMAIAMQDHTGRWYSLKKFALDTIAKTISGSISHFSDWTRFDALRLLPASGKLKVSKILGLQIVLVEPSGEVDKTGGDGDMLVPLEKTTGNEVTYLDKKSKKEKITYSYKVNDVPGGNSVVGRVGVRAGSNAQALSYQAPASVPSQNPVAITVEAKGESFKLNGNVFTSMKIVSNILIYDNAYEVKMEASIISGSPEAWGGTSIYTDKGSFIISMDKGQPEIMEIQNNLETMNNNCEKTILNPATCTGLIHISGVRGIKLTPAQPPGKPYPTIEIAFIQKPVEYTKFKLDCPPPPSTKGRSKGKDDQLVAQAFLLDMKTPGFPVFIKFMAKPGEQTIFQMGDEGSELFVKFTVTQIKDD